MTQGYKMTYICCAERQHLQEPGAPLTHLLVSHTCGGIPRRTSWGLVAKSTVMVSRKRPSSTSVIRLNLDICLQARREMPSRTPFSAFMVNRVKETSSDGP